MSKFEPLVRRSEADTQLMRLHNNLADRFDALEAKLDAILADQEAKRLFEGVCLETD